MRVLHVVRNLEVGGMEQFLVDLANEQIAQGVEVGVHEIAVSRSARIALPNGLVNFPASAADGNIRLMISLVRVFQQFKPDVVHVHNTLALRHCIIPCLCFGKPIVMTKHGMEFYGGLWRWLYRWPDHLVCVSGQVHEQLLVSQPVMRSRSSVILNGVGKADSRPGNRGHWRQQFNLDSNTRAFVWVGRMVKEKGIASMIDAFAARRDDPSWRLYMAGDGPLRTESEARVQRAGLGERVVFLGMRNDVRDILPAFDVFLLPSVSEGLPIALLEAAAAGLPLIVSDVGGMPDVVSRGNGWIVRAGDVGQLAGTLESVCGMPVEQLAKMGARSAEVIRDNYSMAVCARRYDEVYRRVLG